LHSSSLDWQENDSMHSLIRDFRFALRQLRKNLGFTTVTLLTLALGIGATTSMFSLVNTVLLRPLPFREPDRLMSVMSGTQLSPGQPIRPSALSYPDYFDLRNQNHTFSDIASFRDDSVTLVDQQGAHQLDAQIVSANLFRTLGVPPALGRDFNWDDEKPQSNVVMVSHQLWISQFDGATDIVGRSINLNGVPYTVVGVMPTDFTFPLATPQPSIWRTLAVDSYDPAGGEPASVQRGAHFFYAIGRLKDGASVQNAEADLSVIAHAAMLQYPATNLKHPSAVVRTFHETLVKDARPALRLLFGAVAFLLLIACVNVASLLLARTAYRKAEVAVRVALGASRWEIMRQILVESVVLSLIGGLLGIAISSLTLDTVVKLVPTGLPRLNQVAIDHTVFLFALAASVFTGILFGVLPAWRMSQLQPASTMRQRSRTSTLDRSHRRLQDALVIAETAIGMVLLVGSGLLIHSFVRVLRVNPGFDPHNVLVADIGLSDTRYDAKKMVQFYDQLLPQIAAFPGVESVAGAEPVPMSNSMFRISFTIEGQPTQKGAESSEAVGVITPGYFKVMRIPLVRGREFTVRDAMKAPAVVIITQRFADKYFPHEDPIGKRINPGLGDGVTNDVLREIVGVVGDVKMKGLTSEFDPQYYLPYPQAVIGSLPLTIRTSVDPTSIIGQLRSTVASMDVTAPLYKVHVLDDNISQSAAQSRFQATVLTTFAAVALVLFAVGLYGLLSYTVAQRTTEIGVRMALGARRQDMLLHYLRQGLTLAAIGGLVGLVASTAVTKVMSSMLFEVKFIDIPALAADCAVLLLVALIASFIPARRAMAINPMAALKDE
jgi:putative ABC transport system permease protein